MSPVGGTGLNTQGSFGAGRGRQLFRCGCPAHRPAERPAVTGRHVGVIERAYELAQRMANVEEIRTQLRREGYSNVDAHLMGRKIRSTSSR